MVWFVLEAVLYCPLKRSANPLEWSNESKQLYLVGNATIPSRLDWHYLRLQKLPYLCLLNTNIFQDFFHVTLTNKEMLVEGPHYFKQSADHLAGPRTKMIPIVITVNFPYKHGQHQPHITIVINLHISLLCKLLFEAPHALLMLSPIDFHSPQPFLDEAMIDHQVFVHLSRDINNNIHGKDIIYIKSHRQPPLGIRQQQECRFKAHLEGLNFIVAFRWRRDESTDNEKIINFTSFFKLTPKSMNGPTFLKSTSELNSIILNICISQTLPLKQTFISTFTTSTQPTRRSTPADSAFTTQAFSSTSKNSPSEGIRATKLELCKCLPRQIIPTSENPSSSERLHTHIGRSTTCSTISRKNSQAILTMSSARIATPSPIASLKPCYTNPFHLGSIEWQKLAGFLPKPQISLQ